MKKLLLIIPFLFSYSLLCDFTYTQINFKQIHPHQFKWLLSVSKECSNFTHLDIIKANIPYYIQLTKDHIAKLEKKIQDGKTMFSSKRLPRGIGIAAYGIFCSLVLKKIDDTMPKDFDDIISKIFCKAISIGCLTFPLLALKKDLIPAWRYKARLFERLERDRKILATLEAAIHQPIEYID